MPNLGCDSNIPTYTIEEIAEQQIPMDVLLLATPPDVSIATIKLLKHSSIKIIDLSGAFRLPLDELFKWYGITHDIPELMKGAPSKTKLGKLEGWLNEKYNRTYALTAT